jgi:hypothetical protein
MHEKFNALMYRSHQRYSSKTTGNGGTPDPGPATCKLVVRLPKVVTPHRCPAGGTCAHWQARRIGSHFSEVELEYGGPCTVSDMAERDKTQMRKQDACDILRRSKALEEASMAIVGREGVACVLRAKRGNVTFRVGLP